MTRLQKFVWFLLLLGLICAFVNLIIPGPQNWLAFFGLSCSIGGMVLSFKAFR